MPTKFPLIIASLAIFASCGRHAARTDSTSALSIEITTAQTDTVYNRRTFVGNIGANFEAVVQPRVSGYLTAKLFENGMPVRKGDLLFRLDGKQQRATLLSARAALESARAKALEAHNNYVRALPLAKINAISQMQLDQYTAEYVAAEASVKSAEQSLRNAELDVEYTSIRSAINGIISTSAAHIGDLVGPGTKFTTLTTIQNLDSVSVDIAIPMRQYLNLSGRKSFSYENADLLSDVRLFLADGELYPAAGKYSYTKSAISGATGTIIIVVSFANPDYLLKAGQFARVEANVGKGRACVTIPQSCVSQTQNINSVWVIRADSTAEYREVTLGETDGARWVVESGLNDGEKVAVTGQIKLRNGLKVIPQNASDNE